MKDIVHKAKIGVECRLVSLCQNFFIALKVVDHLDNSTQQFEIFVPKQPVVKA